MSKELVKFYPNMVSMNDPFKVSVSSFNNNSYLGYYAFDGSDSTCWNSSNSTTGENWIKIDFKESKRLSNMYMKGDRSFTSFSPKDFTVQVSNDNINWILLTTVEGLSWSSTKELKSFPITLAESGYRYYRIDISSSVDSTLVGITDIHFDELLPSNKSLILHDGEYKKYIKTDSSIMSIDRNYIGEGTMYSYPLYKETKQIEVRDNWDY